MKISHFYRWIVFIILTILALYFTVLGGYLVSLAGSPFYLFNGVMLLIIAACFLSRRKSTLLLFNFLFLITIVWSIWESGFDFWALAPRLDIIFILGLLLIPFTLNNNVYTCRTNKIGLFTLLATTLIIILGSSLTDPHAINGQFTQQQPTNSISPIGVNDNDWPAYGRTQAGIRYSPLTQINSDNVDKLVEKWTFHTGDEKRANDAVEITNEVTPIKIEDNLFLCTPHQYLISLDPATGKEKWRFDSKLQYNKSFQHMTCRGVAYYNQNNSAEFAKSLEVRQPSISDECPEKVFLPVNDGRLIAVNAQTGNACCDFGQNGEINLLASMPYAYLGGYNPTSPPIVTGNTIIIGGSVTDNLSTQEPSGVIRGYDVNSGKLIWVFDTGAEDPNAMPGKETQFVHNSPNAWAPLAYDAQTDVVYIPTGVGTPDIWGGDRHPLKERYANSVLALKGSTGELLWHFQTTHHDLWDMDVPSQPSLVDIKTDKNETIPAIYIVTKTGNVFVLDRRDGTPIVPVTEKPVPTSVKYGPQTQGEHYSPTQPFSALNLAPKNKLQGSDMWGGTMADQLLCRIAFHQLNYEGIYTPPSENGTLVFPGNLGIFEWGGISVNQDRQVAVMNFITLPFISKLYLKDPQDSQAIDAGHGEQGLQPMTGTPYSVDIHPFLSPLGLPCKQPPWGFVAGVDLTKNELVWQQRFGTIRDSLPNLVELPPLKIGVPGLGGAISTAGNVMFVAASQDNYIRAFNVTDGKMLWEARLPAGGQATPMTYSIGGKQYVVIMAGGHGSFGTKMGDSLVAYGLPDNL
ncbi:TPA: membrane-bound PQQ-dependent dehydrogenase, glucose/quinate/shikimate family [Proteus mirabilis]|nr:membrane-bound PQQ-dependent dehydrogenase, glucose/quinate/shikimate family [Proteus mirabilis]HDT1951518.1 membrane-bound PQQ-dependent dehydrogenase, glucose/quinate/shikimate family [Proteus mirabilis]HDU8606908.1 membrane-bound PQQ-dependent dehydrogenase, glucose/quinate/shikimate family [Proteus mirabilis]HDU8613892.1 membrane-bound PQQ-dependent dehydrogenase, glucose/quinate/shikimate family [Proteus mirabilis]HDU8629805.1 membrane-bound PQQ-dependent dehydrogenase, glucose/quinate/